MKKQPSAYVFRSMYRASAHARRHSMTSFSSFSLVDWTSVRARKSKKICVFLFIPRVDSNRISSIHSSSSFFPLSLSDRDKLTLFFSRRFLFFLNMWWWWPPSFAVPSRHFRSEHMDKVTTDMRKFSGIFSSLSLVVIYHRYANWMWKRRRQRRRWSPAELFDRLLVFLFGKLLLFLSSLFSFSPSSRQIELAKLEIKEERKSR